MPKAFTITAICLEHNTDLKISPANKMAPMWTFMDNNDGSATYSLYADTFFCPSGPYSHTKSCESNWVVTIDD